MGWLRESKPCSGRGWRPSSQWRVGAKGAGDGDEPWSRLVLDPQHSTAPFHSSALCGREAATDRERWGSLEWINWQVGFPLGYAGLGGFGKLPEWRCLVGVACPEGPAFPTLPLVPFPAALLPWGQPWEFGTDFQGTAISPRLKL